MRIFDVEKFQYKEEKILFVMTWKWGTIEFRIIHFCILTDWTSDDGDVMIDNNKIDLKYNFEKDNGNNSIEIL